MIRRNRSPRSLRRRLAGFVALAAVTAIALTGCGSNSGAAEGKAAPKTLTIALTADPRTLLGTDTTVQTERNVAEQITEKLIEMAPDDKSFEPRLATSWKQIDPKTVQLKLRQGVKFTNGEPFNAASAKASLEVLMKSPAYAAFTQVLDHVDIVNDHTINVVAVGPTTQLLNAIYIGGFQYPEKYFAKVGAAKFATAPIGTGPFMLEKWTRGDQITMKANPHYWGQKPAASTLIWKDIPDQSAQVAALQSGQVDLIADVPVGSYSTIDDSKTLKLVTRPSDRVFYLAFSELSDTPLKNPAVRVALQHAIDVKSLIKEQLGGRGVALKGQVLAPSFIGFNKELSAAKYDPTLAKKQLAAAGYPNGFSVTFKYPSGRYPQDQEIGQAIADQLSKVGVSVKQEALESGTYLTQLTSLQLNDMFFTGSLTAPDAYVMYQQFRTGAPFSYYSNKEVDSLLTSTVTMTDADQRAAVLASIGKIFQQDPPFVPLFQGTDAYGVAPTIVGFQPRASQFIDVRAIKMK